MKTSDEESPELDPMIMSRIEKISMILNQTNQNLHMFEKLLPASRKESCQCDPSSSLSSQKTQMSELSSANEALQAKVSELEWKVLEATRRAHESEARCDALAEENTTLTLANNELEARLSRLSKHKESSVDEQNITSEKIDQTSKEINLDRNSSSENDEEMDDSQKNLICLQTQLTSCKSSRKKLKLKTRELLEHYRKKRKTLEKRDHQLMSQKAGLLKLEELHRSLQSSNLVVVNHLGMELNVISRLVGLIWSVDSPEMAAPPNLQPCTQTNLSQWFYQTDTNLYWTKQRLVQLALRCTGPPQAVAHSLLLEHINQKENDESEHTLTSASEKHSLFSLSQDQTIKSMLDNINSDFS